MKLCYRGVDYSISASPQSAECFVNKNFGVNLIYRGRHYEPSCCLVNPCIFNALESNKLALQKLIMAKQRYQLTYRGIAYAIAF